jgi:TonB C terminal
LIEHRRLAFALLLSLLIHALLLSLTFGSEGLGLPGFGFPWRDRRIEAPGLSVALVPPQVTPGEPVMPSVAEPLQQAPVEQPAASRPAPTPSASPAPHGLAIVPAARPTAEAKPKQNAAADADTAKAPPRAEGAADAAPTQIPEPPVIDVEPSNEAELVVPPAPSAPMSDVTAAPSVSSADPVVSAPRDAGDAVQERIVTNAQERAVAQAAAAQEAARQEAARQEAARIEAVREAERQEAVRQEAVQLEAHRQSAARQDAARIEAARQEAERREAVRREAAQLEAQRQSAAHQQVARIEAARQEAERQEAARQAAARQAAAELEAQRQEVARQEAARIEATRQEAERQEAARQEAARREAARQVAAELEAQRQEGARQEAARIEAARQEAARQEAARQEAARQEAARQATARQEAARVQAEQAEARREERLRAIGRQLDEEAARREAASTADRQPNLLPRSLSTARRIKLFGRAHPNVELIHYAEAWAQKIQFNTGVETVREVAKRPHRDPLVTVAIRSDGSVESVTFEVSSGVAEVDDAIRRIVEGRKPYVAFPPALAREYDVVEIRRTWHFDTALRLQ